MTIDNFLRQLADKIINPLIAIFVGIALLYFIWGVIEFLAQAGNEEAKTTGKKHMIWGIIGMAIMLGVGGIIKILQSFFEPGVGIGGGFLT
ncbi:MAG: hypothetical protein A2931_01805 [Candidatus Niyogibacteria bacterium RIFCSPLOWO2_01_FULL_45_48]|uniref:Uncharacterized protein n=2 Tax=Candidatus Niyogiibacteriota TaxID=1817912 RepID=A0A1G2EZT3_9BACT|nr:MAG: hypothetical protein A2835_01700 [Candidatus Niyogibacteria bacterium RIFCSPHIGHO2_01_FULL_45_28]OGZ30818.1 MAG: hypothetical protein A2931_01805 [Candidatus Niyogibacteria bacterium RIFCSPLOWO2_01_FULL_45_48]OGZ31197.1 MAG: hypothetical protein A3J00_01460 [Candidatus Niyogibacteria bacterium RIFCSPLOWO2_02_FULL_45_13]